MPHLVFNCSTHLRAALMPFTLNSRMCTADFSRAATSSERLASSRFKNSLAASAYVTLSADSTFVLSISLPIASRLAMSSSATSSAVRALDCAVECAPSSAAPCEGRRAAGDAGKQASSLGCRQAGRQAGRSSSKSPAVL